MSYSDDDYDAYDDYDDYDVVDHMTNDPIDFQINGYGGFGYDTSHIGPDEPRSEMCLSAFQGDLNGVMDIVERAAAISEEERIKVINYARKWTEVDYRASGFTKEWTWWDLTPVAMAAALGHHEVVQYLLEQSADPTLRGSPTENGSVDALGSAKTNLDYETKQGSDVKCNNAQRCVDLLSVANLFWEKASYSSPHYSTTVRAVFSNRPTNNQMLQEALQNVPEITEYPEKKLRDADLECLKDTASPMLMCSDCNESKHSSLFTEQQILMGRSAKCKECVRQIRVEAARGTRQKKVPLPRSSYGISFGDNYYDDDYDDYLDNYDSTPVTYYRPDGDTEGKDVQWCKDKGFFEVEEGLWSGEWYNKTELVCRGCNESKHTALFSDRERMRQEFGISPKCKVCARKEPSENFLFRGFDDDTDEVTFFRPDGDTETKDVQWCLDNGFFEVEKGLWSGEWYYELDLQKRKSLRRQTMLARFSVNDKPSPPQSTKDTATASMSPGNTDCLTIRIKDRAGEEKQYKVKSTTKMKKTFDTYARDKKVDMGSLRFTFCGVIVQPDQTPAMLGPKLGLKDKSVIECFVDPMEEPKSTSAKKEAPTTSTMSAPPLFTFGSASLTTPNPNDEKKVVASPFSSYGKGSTDEKQKQKSPISFGEAAVGNSFSIGSSEKKKQATIKSTSIKSSIGFGKSCCKDTGLPFSFGKAGAFSVGSSEMKEKMTSTSANRQTQNPTLSFGSTEGNTSSSPFCFDATPQTMLGSPSRPGTSPSSTTFLFGNSAISSEVPKSAMMKVDRNKINLSVESAISLLESLPPDEILPHQAARIKVLAQMLEGASEKKDGVQSALFQATLLQDESLKRASIERDDTRDDYFGHVCLAVFDDDYLLSTILHFEGSLAMSETSYNLVVGYQHPKPYNTDEPSANIQHLGTPSNALVCKKWKSFVIGEKGREAWTIILNDKDNKLINLAKDVVHDESMPWSARLLAMAIADDTASLYRAFDDMEDDLQGIGAAFEEADRDEDDDYEENLRSLEVKCPRGHPFSQCCHDAQLFTYDVTSGCEDTVDDWSALFACNIAYAAAKVGSVGALSFIEEFHGPGLWSKWFDDCGTNFIGSLVFYSCHFPVLEGPVSSVRHLLDNESSDADDHTLHFRHSGCNGNNLHLAAARGHKSLVKVLLEGGMDPTERCTKISPGQSNQIDICVKELPLAADWAAVRGYLDVAELLRQHQSLLRPDLRSPSMHYQTGKLSTFFPASSREYGFIEPGGIFVHLTQLRINSEDSNGFPLPGQKLCFTVTKDRRGRKRADVIFDGTDFSHLRLPLCRWEAELEWGRYKWAGTDDSEDNEDHEDSDY